LRRQLIPGGIPDDRALLAADDQSLQCIILNLLAADDQSGASQPYIAGYPSIDSTLAGEQGISSSVLIVHDYSKARGSGVVCENSAPDIGVVLSTGMSGKNCAAGCIGTAAYYRLPPQAGTPVYVAVV